MTHTQEDTTIQDNIEVTTPETTTAPQDDTNPEILQLEQKLKEAQEIAKKAQYDYITLKFDFDGYRKRTEENAEVNKVDTLCDVVRKFIPFVESLRKSLDVIGEDAKNDPMTQGVQMTYNKFLQTLEQLSITPIESIGLAPDANLHEPVSTQPTDDKQLKGKIIQEFER